MAYRQIHTQIWRDEWFQELDTESKLLWIYLFSNDSSNILGLYKLNLRVAEFDTGLSKSFIEQAIKNFQNDGKVIYQDDYIWIVNLLRYNFNKSDKTVIHIKNELSKISDIPIKIAYVNHANTVLIPYGYSIDGISSVYITGAESDTESGTVEESESVEEKTDTPPPTPVLTDDLTLQRYFQQLTSMMTFPSTSRSDDLERLHAIYSKERGNIVEYLRPYWNEWLSRGYSKVNTAWLDWAVAGQIPKRKIQSNNGGKPKEKLEFYTCPVHGIQVLKDHECPQCVEAEDENSTTI